MYMGLDMSLHAAGVCALRSDGAVAMRTIGAVGKNNKQRRESQVSRVLELIPHGVELICIEQIVMHGSNTRGAAQLITLGEVMADELVARGVPTIKIVPVSAKKYFSGSGRADKAAMIQAAQRRGYDPEDDNQADALALAVMARDICRCRSGETAELTRGELELLSRYIRGVR